MSLSTLLLIVLGGSAGALIFAVGLSRWVMARDTGTPEMRKISDAIQEGAEAYLRRQNKTIAMLAVAVAAILAIGYGMLRTSQPTDPVSDRGMLAMFITLSFALGALSSAIAEAATPAVAAQVPGMDTTQLAARVDQIALTPGGGALMAEILHDVHARMIGDQDGPVEITGDQLAVATRVEAAAAAPAVELPVPRIGALVVLDTILSALVPFVAIAAVVAHTLATEQAMAQPDALGWVDPFSQRDGWQSHGRQRRHWSFDDAGESVTATLTYGAGGA